MHLDTQIISDYYKKISVPIEKQVQISSVTAAEFLLMQSGLPHKPNYYPISPSRMGHGCVGMVPPESAKIFFDSRKHAASGKHRTDHLILDFGKGLQPVIEFGSMAISEQINGKHVNLFAASIAHLDKSLQKKLLRRFNFLIKIDAQCVPLTRQIATIGMNLLVDFLDKYQSKSNMRNTLNDLLILSTAFKHSTQLLTRDNLLNRFALETI